MQIITAAHMRVANENLRHGPSAVGALHHFGFAFGLGPDVHLDKGNTFVGQQTLGCVAKPAQRGSVNLDVLRLNMSFIMASPDLGILDHARQYYDMYLAGP